MNEQPERNCEQPDTALFKTELWLSETELARSDLLLVPDQP